MDRVDTAMGELVARYIQLELGTTYATAFELR